MDSHDSRFIDDLMRPDAYARTSTTMTVSLRQTHISWVFLTDREAVKVKKPVDFGFLDFRTIEKRRVACEAEVVLNRRLAPSVYLGVVPVGMDVHGRACFGGDGPPIDWAVHMVRLPDEGRADERLAAGGLVAEDIDRIALRIATFHACAREDAHTREFGSVEQIRKNVEENFAQVGDSLASYLTVDEANEVREFQRGFLREKASLLSDRARAGRVRDGHGDLRLEHVYLGADGDGEITILDCIEFNERFRFADVSADLAFLSMDLASHGRVDLAERLLAVYARESSDFDLYGVVDFYASYRAFVRGKIANFAARDSTLDDDTRARAKHEARRYFLLALSATRPSICAPRVVAVGGVIASGKSTIADRIGAELSAPVVEADRTRKDMLCVPVTHSLKDGAWSGAYDPAFTDKVYAELLRRAEAVLASGRPVVLDASFRSRQMRAQARELATRHGVSFRLVECRAPVEACRQRLVERATAASVSDGRLEIFDAFCAKFEPMDELRGAEHLVLDTSEPVQQSVALLRERLDAWPHGLTA